MTKRFGRGQGHPTGWTLEELKEGWSGMDVQHVAVCCFDDLINEIERLRGELDKAHRLSGQMLQDQHRMEREALLSLNESQND